MYCLKMKFSCNEHATDTQYEEKSTPDILKHTTDPPKIMKKVPKANGTKMKKP